MGPHLPKSNDVLSWLNNVKMKLRRKAYQPSCCNASPRPSISSATDNSSSDSRSYTLQAIYTPRSVNTFAAEAFGSFERLYELKHTRSLQKRSSQKLKPLESNPVRVEVASVRGTPESTNNGNAWPLISKPEVGVALDISPPSSVPETAIVSMPSMPPMPEPARVLDRPNPPGRNDHEQVRHHHQRVSSEIVVLPSVSSAYMSEQSLIPQPLSQKEFPAFPLTHFCDGTCHGDD